MYPQGLNTTNQILALVQGHHACSASAARRIIALPNFPKQVAGRIDGKQVWGYEWQFVCEWLEKHDEDGLENDAPKPVDVYVAARPPLGSLSRVQGKRPAKDGEIKPGVPAAHRCRTEAEVDAYMQLYSQRKKSKRRVI
ncbi:MAG: hypothetical protein AAFX02_08805 [Pseudomonadota bacterium]